MWLIAIWAIYEEEDFWETDPNWFLPTDLRLLVSVICVIVVIVFAPAWFPVAVVQGRGRMRSIPLNQGKEALVSDEDFEHLNQWIWSVTISRTTAYATRQTPRPSRKTVYMHKVIAARMGINGRTDHKDRNGLNNQRENLRRATRSQNQLNQDRSKMNTSGYRGVSWSSIYNKWHVRTYLEGKPVHVGYYNDPVEAARAYDRAARRLHGEFAVLNFPTETT